MRKIHCALLFLLCLSLVEGLMLARPLNSIDRKLDPDASGQTVTEKSEKLRQWERQQEKARNKQRQEDLKKDTDKLLQLATDLKLAVDKSNEQTLSMDVLKKAEEIEKLSKGIQRKMKGE